MTDRLRAREIRERLKGRVDPQVSYVLEQLAETQSVYEQQLMDMAQLIDQISSIVSNFIAVAENMKSATETMQKKFLPEGIHIQSGPGEED